METSFKKGEHLVCQIVPESGLWAYLSHGPSLLDEGVGEYLFQFCWTLPPPPAQYKHRQLVLQKLLLQIPTSKLHVILYQVLA